MPRKTKADYWLTREETLDNCYRVTEQLTNDDMPPSARAVYTWEVEAMQSAKLRDLVKDDLAASFDQGIRDDIEADMEPIREGVREAMREDGGELVRRAGV